MAYLPATYARLSHGGNYPVRPLVSGGGGGGGFYGGIPANASGGVVTTPGVSAGVYGQQAGARGFAGFATPQTPQTGGFAGGSVEASGRVAPMNPAVEGSIDVAKMPAAAPAASPAQLTTTPTTPSAPSKGFAIVDGKRIAYEDIGTKADPLRNKGGFVMSAGSTVAPDPNVGLAVQDAQNRQALLDAPQTLGQRLGGIRMGNGPGGIVNAMMQSKVAKDDANRAKTSFNQAAVLRQLDTKDSELALKQDEQDINRGYKDTLADMYGAQTDLYKSQAEMEKLKLSNPAEYVKRYGGAATDNKDTVALLKNFTEKTKDPIEAVKNTQQATLLMNGGVPITTAPFKMDGKEAQLRGVVHPDNFARYAALAKELETVTNDYNNQFWRSGADKDKLKQQRAIIFGHMKNLGVEPSQVTPGA